MHLEAALQRLGAVIGTGECGECGGRNVADGSVFGAADAGDELEAVHPGHAEIDDEHVGREFRDAEQRIHR